MRKLLHTFFLAISTLALFSSAHADSIQSFQTGQVQIDLPQSEEEKKAFLEKFRAYHTRIGVSFGRVKEAYVAERIEASERESFFGDIRAVHQEIARAEKDGKFEAKENADLGARFKRQEDYLNFILNDRALGSHVNGNEKVEELEFKAPHQSGVRDAEFFENIKADALRLGMIQGEITEASKKSRLSEQNKSGLQHQVLQLDGLIVESMEDLELSSSENSEIEEKFEELEEAFEAEVGAPAVGFTGASQFVPQVNASGSSRMGGSTQAGHHHHGAPKPKSTSTNTQTKISLQSGLQESDPLQDALAGARTGGVPGFSTKVGSAGSTTDIVIAAGERFVLDRNVDVGTITIRGQLLCPNSGEYVLSTQGIMVEGSGLFQCGSSSQGFQGKLTVKLKDGKDLHGMGRRVFGAMDGGTIRLVGDGRKAGWQRIAETINAGSNTLVLSRPASDWEVGDRIVVAPTGFNTREAEERIVTSIDSNGRVIQVNEPFRYPHFGEVQTFNEGQRNWKLDQRAEVANLTRNIKVMGAGDPGALDAAQFGGHMMIMVDSFGYIDGIELAYMGQMGFLGRYPFHWHLAGNVQGQYIKNSSIWNSYQRCVSVHGTHNALLENNVCYNHFGHGFFLENGSETGNSFLGNLTIWSRVVPEGKHLLISDVRTPDTFRFPATSGFWISNPDNIVRGNVVAGSEGTGFWMSFQQEIRCAGNHCDHPDSMGGRSVKPAHTVTREFNNNVAHTAGVGMTWDGAPDGGRLNNPRNPSDREITTSHYYYNGDGRSTGNIPVFNNLVVYKNRASGIYFRGHTAIYRNLIAADNFSSLFFAYNQVVDGALIVGMSANHSSRDLEFLKNMNRRGRFHGVRLYDGPWDLRNVHFANFATAPVIHEGVNYTPIPFMSIGGAGKYMNVARGISFAPQPIQRFAFDRESGASLGWQDAILLSTIIDADGSLAGSAGKLIVPLHAMNQHPSCETIPNERALRCDYRMGTFNLMHTGAERNLTTQVLTGVSRSDGAAMPWDNVGHFSKIGVIMGSSFQYRITLANQIVTRRLRIEFDAHSSAPSPVIEMVGVPSGCQFNGARQVNSLEELKRLGSISGFAVFRGNGGGQSYGDDEGFNLGKKKKKKNKGQGGGGGGGGGGNGGSVYVRVGANQVNDRNMSEYAPRASTNRVDFECSR